jgi:hypothetical protein
MLKNTFYRFIVFSLLWFAFWAISTKIASVLSKGIIATFWSQGIIEFPIIALIFLLVDLKIKKKKWFDENVGKYMLTACIISFLLYYPIALVIIAASFIS